MKRSIHSIALAVLVATVSASPGYAQGSKQDAVQRYKQGRALIEKKQYEEALRELTASYELMDSPNTLLLMAHAERELGRLGKAASLYEQVVEDAKKRVAAGEARFQKTVDDADGWLRKLSELLGKLTVVVTHAPEGTTITVNGDVVDTTRSDDTLRVDAVWWPAGSVKVEATTEGGVTRAMTAEVPKGGPASVALDLGGVVETQEPAQSLKPEPMSVETDDLQRKTIPTASWVTGGIGVAGLATFAIFGSMAKSKSEDLDACAPRCPESERDTADAGKRDQTIANVGLAVGGIGLAAAAGFYIFQKPPEQDASVSWGVSPNGLVLRGQFH